MVLAKLADEGAITRCGRGRYRHNTDAEVNTISVNPYSNKARAAIAHYNDTHMAYFAEHDGNGGITIRLRDGWNRIQSFETVEEFILDYPV